IPIDQFCDKQQLTPRQRLELFVSVCQAVHHAHQKRILHRDIKPGNVLVARKDGKPVAKVIDFGLAKALEEPLAEYEQTQVGTFLGTPEYMSPEQAEATGDGVDTPTDVYSLGVLLYELLTGTTPLDLPKKGRMDRYLLRQRIREEEAPKPSTRVAG